MPEKSVREMSALERKHYSLAARTFHATVIGAIILGAVTLLLGLGLYTYSVTKQYITQSFYLTRSVAAVLEEKQDVSSIADAVMTGYRAQSQEELDQIGTEAYRRRFAHLARREDYAAIRSVLSKFYGTSNMDDIYLATYDLDTSAIVYMVDPDEDDVLHPGEWEPVEKKEAARFLSWDGEGMLYDIGNTEKYGWLCTSGTPIRNSEGEVCAFVLADISLKNIGMGIRTFLLQYSLILLVVVNLYAYLLTRHMKKTLVAPIDDIAEAAETYVKDRRAGRTDTEHFASLNIRTGDEVENLALTMADMERDLGEYEENLKNITAEKERITLELSLATRIQADMLPNIFPAFPGRAEFDVYASMTPAREVGGDFYDFFLVDDDHLCMVMADVSGKGVPAALFMMASKIILANNAMLGRSPAEILTFTNAAICSNNREEMFVTVWLGILEISTGKLTAANAGHEFPALKGAGGRYELVKDKHGFVIGGMDGIRYQQYELQLEPGSRLFLYTDGVPEATDAGEQMFGTDRMLEALNCQPDAAPEQVLRSVQAAVDDFVQDAEQFDDLTMLCLEYKGPDGAGEGKEENHGC